jgi:RNA polymerase sigma-70 factor (ECF subfamily)
MTVRELQPSCSAVVMGSPPVAISEPRVGPTTQVAPPDRFRSIVDKQYDFLWRTVRYLGVPEGSAEDAIQQALCIVARRLADIAPGTEMSFLFSTAMRVASEWRRSGRRHPAISVEDVDKFVGPGPTPEQLVDTRRAQEVLCEIVQAMPVELRIVFILCEIEELTVAEAADCVGVPPGTVASRLRRAREKFKVLVRRRVALATSASGGRR